MPRIKLPLFFSFYFLIFLAVPVYGVYFQLASMLLLIFQNLVTLAVKRDGSAFFGKQAPPPAALLLVFILPLQSLFNSITQPDPYFAAYSIVFFAVALSIFIIVSTVDFHAILDSFSAAAIATFATVLLTGMDELKEALSIHINLDSGLTRFSPLALHPNLVGHLFGGFCIIFFCYFLHARSRAMQGAALVLTLASVTVSLATSSRGGTLSAVVAILCISLLAMWNSPAMRRNFSLCVALLLLAVWATQGLDKIVNYLTAMLAFDNDYRGVNSGLSGRTANWHILMAAWSASPYSILIGNGLRSGSEDLLRYNIDSGYLTLLYEMGLVPSVLFVFFIVSGLSQLRRSILRAPDLVKSAAFGYCVFILMESMVARYLLSLGNPVSLLLIYFLLGINTILGAAPTTAQTGTKTAAVPPCAV